MKTANIFVTYLLLILTLLSASCGKDEERSDLFDFDLINGLSLEGTDEFLQLPMAYVDTLYEWDTVHLHFNDGAVGDSLITECGNWSYEENPTTTFEVWFTDTFVEDGIYEFSLGTGADDFSLIIRRDLIFGPVDQSGFMIENAMMSQNIVARGFFSVIDSEPHQVTNAYIQLEHWNTPDQMMRIVLELQNEDVVRGSYRGMFQPFKRIEYDSDCD